MAVAFSGSRSLANCRDSTVAERMDHATDGESVVQNNGAVTVAAEKEEEPGG